jgi:methylaspartate ammonia-lyase
MLSVMLMLDDGQVAYGDCMDVIFSGAAGRDPVFRVVEHLPMMESVVRPRLLGRALTAFRPTDRTYKRHFIAGPSRTQA